MENPLKSMPEVLEPKTTALYLLLCCSPRPSLQTPSALARCGLSLPLIWSSAGGLQLNRTEIWSSSLLLVINKEMYAYTLECILDLLSPRAFYSQDLCSSVYQLVCHFLVFLCSPVFFRCTQLLILAK